MGKRNASSQPGNSQEDSGDIQNFRTQLGWSALEELDHAQDEGINPWDFNRRAGEILADALGSDRAVLLLIDGPGLTFRAVGEEPEGADQAARVISDALNLVWSQASLIDGQSLAVQDAAKDPLVPADFRDRLVDLGIASMLCVPVARAGKAVAAACAYAGRVRRWRPEDAALLRTLGSRAWSGLGQTQTTHALRHQKLELERLGHQLRRLSSELTLAEHNARQVLSRTLHDGLQQQLVCAKLALEEAIGRLGKDPVLTRAHGDLREAIDSARSLSVEVFPPVLHNGGLADALAWLAVWARRKFGLSISAAVDESVDTLALDARVLLFESVRELVFNAVKHARAGSAHLELTRQGNDQIQIMVSDTGVGFDPRSLQNKSRRGDGMGLLSVRERLTLLGGEMEIRSRPGGGCQVFLRAPADSNGAAGNGHAHGDTAGGHQRRRQDGAHPEPPGLLPLRVLIADDHEHFRQNLRLRLAARSEICVIGEASDGAQAVRKALELLPDVVLMDVGMPLLDGVAATRTIRQQCPNVAVLGLSVQAQDFTEPMAKAGAFGCLSKEVSLQALVSALESRPNRQAGLSFRD